MRKVLSFCITCKNRLWQLERTLAKNLNDNAALESKIEFVLVDFGSTDGLVDWIKEVFKMELKKGYLKYYFTEQLPNWHASIAKNTAHLFANGRIVTNLDCDNFTGRKGAQFILNCFGHRNAPIMLHQFRGEALDGSFGRISLNKDIFSCIGGYDEEFYPMGFQDIDLLARLWVSGVQYVAVRNSNFNNAIRNTKEESIAQCNLDMSYPDMDSYNRDLSLRKITTLKNPIRNGGTYGIWKNVYNHKNEIVYPEFQKNDLDEIMSRYSIEPNKDISFLLKYAYGQ
jgi:glycosyltransferase involved in cell wall biosynthesis